MNAYYIENKEDFWFFIFLLQDNLQLEKQLKEFIKEEIVNITKLICDSEQFNKLKEILNPDIIYDCEPEGSQRFTTKPDVPVRNFHHSLEIVLDISRDEYCTDIPKQIIFVNNTTKVELFLELKF